MGQLANLWDPGNKHFIPYMWGTHGVTYNEELVKATYPDAPIGSMDMIFDPETYERVSKVWGFFSRLSTGYNTNGSCTLGS